MHLKNLYVFILIFTGTLSFSSPLLFDIGRQKGIWRPISAISDKMKYSDNLIKLVQTAYRSTAAGSYVNRQEDVLASDWYVINCDDSADINAAIFFRSPRSDEPWSGYKIQGAGHDGSLTAKALAINKRKELAKQEGWWMEAAGAVEHIMYKDSAIPYIADQETAQRLFPNAALKMIGHKGRYARIVPGVNDTPQTIFGRPLFKN